MKQPNTQMDTYEGFTSDLNIFNLFRHTMVQSSWKSTVHANLWPVLVIPFITGEFTVGTYVDIK